MNKNKNSPSHIGWRLLDGVTMFIVTALSLLLLLYVGYGEAKRTFTHFQTDKVAAQGRLLQTTLEHFLRPGLPLKQFVGFQTNTDSILNSDASIVGISAVDMAGVPVFVAGEMGELVYEEKDAAIDKSFSGEGAARFAILQNSSFLQVVIPLRNRFEQVGTLRLTLPHAVVENRVRASFKPVLVVSLVAAALFGVFVAFSAASLADGRRNLMQIVYSLIFTMISGAVVATLVALYSEGAQAKTKGLADSLGQRIGGILEIGLPITAIQGLDTIFQDYKRLNPDIRSAALIVDGIAQVHTTEIRTGLPWKGETGDYEYEVDLGRSAGRAVHVAVSVPGNIVVSQTVRSVKNFAALFVASAFMAGIFLQFAGSVQIGRLKSTENAEERLKTDRDTALQLVKPVFFVAVLAEHLTYAFLPQFIQSAVVGAGLPPETASVVFTSYFLAFAFVLIPAGYFAQHFNARPLMYTGLMLSAAGLFVMATYPGFEALVIARIMSGFGQGLVFIGVQSYILAASGPHQKTQGSAIIVFGFQGGMISGMAIGSLLVTQLGEYGVFTLAAALALAITFYTVALVPTVQANVSESRPTAGPTNIFQDLRHVLGSIEFLRTIFLIGIPTKAVLTGVVMFALPLLMQSAGYLQEDIGQVLMIYAGGVVFSSAYMSRAVDRSGNTQSVLVFGALLAGVGMVLIGITDARVILSLEYGERISMIILVLGAAVVGIAHGFINAPVVTHVVNSSLSDKIGEASTSAAYRFLERAGHVTGPLIVGQLFLMQNQSAWVIAQLGVAVAILGLLFSIRLSPPAGQSARIEEG